MTTMEIVLLVVVLLLVVAAVAAAVVARSRRRAQLQSTFGSEYDRTVERTGGRSAAERELAERAERRRSLDIRPLPETDRLAYAERWRATQADFVDRPSEAVRDAGQLVTQVMAQRGYPVDDPEQMARDVSVDHAETVEEYRSAQAISELNDRRQASTEQLRQAMVHYRALFDDLLTDRDGSTGRTPAATPASAEHVPDRTDDRHVPGSAFGSGHTTDAGHTTDVGDSTDAGPATDAGQTMDLGPATDEDRGAYDDQRSVESPYPTSSEADRADHAHDGDRHRSDRPLA